MVSCRDIKDVGDAVVAATSTAREKNLVNILRCEKNQSLWNVVLKNALLVIGW